MTDNLQKRIKVKKLEILYRQTYSSLLFPTILAVSMAYVYRGLLSITFLSLWLLAFLFVTGLRFYRARVFIRSENTSSNLDYWFSWHLFGVIISGIIWGGFILLLAKSADSTYLGLAIGCAVGLCAGAAAVYSFSFISFILFAITVLSPAGVFLVMAEHSTINVYGYFIFLFLVIMFVISWRLSKITTNFLDLQFENKKLFAALETEREQIIESNKKLEEDIKTRIQTEATLLYEKKAAEDVTEELKILSTQDSLTGINNRRRFDEALYDEWYRASRLSNPLSLIMCDIDKFKEYNDAYGHLEGDKCLTRIAHLIEDSARRASDMAARFGGEEFTIILPDTGYEQAKEIAEQVRMAIVDLALPHNTSSVANIITASFGVCTTAPNKDTSPKTLIECADKAMYLAKKQGRNKVVSYQKVSEEEI